MPVAVYFTMKARGVVRFVGSSSGLTQSAVGLVYDDGTRRRALRRFGLWSLHARQLRLLTQRHAAALLRRFGFCYRMLSSRGFRERSGARCEGSAIVPQRTAVAAFLRRTATCSTACRRLWFSTCRRSECRNLRFFRFRDSRQIAAHGDNGAVQQACRVLSF